MEEDLLRVLRYQLEKGRRERGKRKRGEGEGKELGRDFEILFTTKEGEERHYFERGKW
jgi:hypothetical protein